jgi:hypothetical protein
MDEKTKSKTENMPNAMSDHEHRNEGGREFGHIHQPTQAQQASSNEGLAETTRMGGSPSAEGKLKRAREGNQRTA